MAPRTILYTGKGGVGKTSVATATARRCAAAGARGADHVAHFGDQHAPLRIVLVAAPVLQVRGLHPAKAHRRLRAVDLRGQEFAAFLGDGGFFFDPFAAD
jgi:hypothetical protein